MITVVWYLIINNGYNGGVTAIPQAGEKQCVANVRYLREMPAFNRGYVTCIPGVK